MRNDSGERPARALARPRTVGEGATSAILGALPSEEWTVFDGVRLAGRRTPVQVAVGPQGAFVVESRRRPLLPVLDELRAGGVRQDVVVAATRCAEAVTSLTGLLEPRHVTAVVCFLGREVEPVVAGDVVICSSRSLLAVLTTGAVLLDADTRGLATMDLDTSIGVPPRTARPRSRRWLRAQLFGLALACAGSLGLWQLADHMAGPDRPAHAASALVR